MPAPEPLTVGTIITLALGSSVVGSLVAQGFTSFRERQSSRRQASYLALRLATIFEKYAHDASGIISEMDDYENSGGQMGGYASELPKLSELPDEKERWRDLPVSFSSRVLGFEPYRQTVQGGIDNCFEIVGVPEGYAEIRAQCAKLGCRALDIARDLRLEFGLPELETEWNWVAYLRRALTRPPGS
jgi:hypothetical protein